MGRDKALLDFKGRTFLSRAVAALRHGGCARVYVVVRRDHAEVDAEARATGAVVLTNPDPGDGPITSLRYALEHLAQDDPVSGLVWLPLDFPLVEARHVALLTASEEAGTAPLALLVHRGKRGHPVRFHPQLFPELSDRTVDGGARTVVHRYLESAHLIDVDDPAVVTDVDTPEAFQRVLSDIGSAS